VQPWQFLGQNWHQPVVLAWQHAWLVSIAVFIAILTGMPIGIWIPFNQEVADIVLYLAGIIMTIPSIALFGIMVLLLSLVGHGIGTVPAIVALVLYSQLPMIRNTYAAIKNVDPNTIGAGIGMGMTRGQLLARVVLQDDLKYFPVYNPAPAVREAIAKKYPELKGIFAQLATKLDTQTMTELNYAVDGEHKNVSEVSKDWLKKVGLI
jgi:hypothetical protein